MKKSFLFLFLVSFLTLASAQEYQLSSPDGRLSSVVKIGNGISVSLNSGSRNLMKIENISLLTDNKTLNAGFKVRKSKKRSVNEILKPQIREKTGTIANNFNELELSFKSGLGITFRMFNEGLAYRFSTTAKDSLTIFRENMDVLPEPGDSARFLSSASFNSCWETPYEHSSIAGIEKGKLCNIPFLVTKVNGSFIMITEADIYDYPGLWLKGTGMQHITATNPPYPKTLSYKGSVFDHGQVAEAYDYIARVKGTRDYPWRIFAVADGEKELIASNIVWLLASPTTIQDVSWIKPGVVMFDWWAKYNIFGVDFKSGINTETAKYFIDFCAQHGIRYFMFDDGWCPEEDLLHPVAGLDMQAVTAYAQSKGVDIILWVIWHALQKQWDDAFTQFSKWGVKGIKMDFMNRDDQPMVRFYEDVARKAAENHMIVDFHGAYKPDGLSRKYPNVLTREALIEFEYNGWTQYDTPEHHNLLPYIRMFNGAMDYIPATMKNSTKDDFRAVFDYPMGQGTRAHALALWIVLSSPLTMLPDSPSDYNSEKECTDFIAGLPVVWDETHLLKGKIGEYTVIARRSGGSWYVGAITDWNSRDLEIATDFLAPGTYRVEAISDGVNADRRAEDYCKTETIIQSGKKLELHLASGGGWIAKLTPLSSKVSPFGLTNVKLLEGPFRHATELDIKTILGYDPDRLLSRFFAEAGLKPKAEHYMGWENETLAGHTLGHYLSACSMMYQTTGDDRFLQRVNYIVSELKTVQEADGSGYIGAFPKGRKVFEDEVAKGDIRAKGFDLNGIWSPFYTIHKILAGLRDAYQLCGNKQALEVERKFADWIGGILSPLSDDQIQEMLKCEYGGMMEVLADLYADTGEGKYLKLSEKFYDKVVLDPLKAGRDILPRRHGNTNIPKLIGLARLYELTDDTTDRKAAEFFWKTVVYHHSYVTGGNGNKEYFGPADSLRNRLGPETTESCNVYNMLKLTGHLFKWEASAEKADFYERALFNHILSTQNPETGNVTYNLSLGIGYFKAFQDPMDFTCCIGTGMENHSKYGENIYYHNADDLYVFQYIASELKWKDKGITLRQATAYPEEQGTALEFSCEKPVKLTLQVRYPSWARNGINIMVNGKPLKVTNAPGSFVAIDRTWHTGDKVEVKIPFSLRIESMPDDSNRVALMYGPLLLAGDAGSLSDSAEVNNVPLLVVKDRNPSVWLREVEGKMNTFTTVNTGRPHEVEFRPFYTFYDRRYSVYWDFIDEQTWNAKKKI